MQFELKLLSGSLFAFCAIAGQVCAQEAPTHHDDELVSIALSVSSSTLAEFEDDAINVKLVADRPVSDPLVVQLNLSGTAIRNLDYEIDSTLAVFDRGDDEAHIGLVPLRDWIWEGDETIQLEIVSLLGDGRIGAPSQLVITILDDEPMPEQGEPNHRPLRYLSDVYTYSYMRIDEAQVSVAVIVINHGAVRSEKTSVTLVLAGDPSVENVVHSARRDVPELDPIGAASNDYFWGEFIHIPMSLLQASTTYYGEISLESYDGEAYTYNNDDNFGFVVDFDKSVQSQCNYATIAALITGPDPLFDEQWHIENTGQSAFSVNSGRSGEDLHMQDTIASRADGEGVHVAVVDTGLETCHPDLKRNIEHGASYNFLTDRSTTGFIFGSTTADPFNVNIYGDHGTSVAGLIGASANNAIGVRGIAPQVRLRGFNFLLRGTDSSQFDSLGGSSYDPDSTDVDVFNMSYGSTRWQAPSDDLYQLFEFGAKELREGKGAIYVKSAGNGWYGCDAIFHPIHREIGCNSSSMDYKNRLPYLLVVGALDADGRPAPYSSSGATLWISAPGGWWGRNRPALVTTDQIGEERGYHLYGTYGLRPDNQLSYGDYISTFNGTSGAAAIVSGVVALMLDRYPDLTWRDVKHALAKTARQSYVDTSRIRVVIDEQIYTLSHGWQLNDAGYAFHNRYGFGAVDVDAAMDFLRDYTADSLGEFRRTDWLAPETFETVEIPDGRGSGTTVEILVEAPHSGMALEATREAFARANIEMVHVQVELGHDEVRHLGITLISPSGMESVLNPVFNDGLPRDDAASRSLLLASNAFYGESPVGRWRVQVVDAMPGESGSLKDVKLRFYYGSHQ